MRETGGRGAQPSGGGPLSAAGPSRDTGDAVETWAMALLKSGPRAQVSSLQKQRVWLSLSYSNGRMAAPLWRRTVVATGVLFALLGVTAMASAARGHWPEWAVRAYQRLLPASDSPLSRTTHAGPVPTRPSHAPAATRPDGPGVVAANDDLAAADVTPSLDEPLGTSVPRSSAPVNRQRPLLAGGAARRLSAPAARVPGRVSVGASDESRPVLAAMRALRRDNDPVRARALLRKYLGDHPDGTLAEEALAISIEAALAHRDADANALGHRYLERYPHGPFRGLAAQATASSSLR